MNRRNRKRKPARRGDLRDVRQRLLIVCEGKRTEPEYLRGFQRWCRNALVDVDYDAPAGEPLTLVNRARALREDAAREARRKGDDNLSYDQVWCVFDRDDHPHFNEAIGLAQQHLLELAVSNPSFELWLLLHFRQKTGRQHRNVIRRLLKAHVPTYDKGVDFEDYREKYWDAYDRAARLGRACNTDGEPFRNPSTGIYALTEQIALYSSHVTRPERPTTA